MRTGETQSSPTAHPDCRVYIDSVLTGDCYASVVIGVEPARLVSVEAIEAVRGGRYTIEIDNSDSALSNKDYEGKKLYIGFGFVGTDKSFLHELRVHKQSFVSKEGKLLLKLIAIDNLGLLSFYKGNLGGDAWNFPNQSMDYLDSATLPSKEEIPDDLKTAINAQYEQTPLDIVTSVVGDTIGADVVLIDDDGYVDSTYPLVSAPDARSTVLQALEATKCYLLCSTNGFKIVQPDAHSTVYSYNAANLFFNNVIEQEAVIPNRVIFHGIDEDDELISTGATHGKNQASIDRLGEIAEHKTYGLFDIEAYETQEDLDSIADALMAKIELSKATGLVVAPMHCSQELFDKISITDSRYSTPITVTGYIFEIQRVYDRGKYTIAFYLGGVSNDYTPSGGADVIPSPITVYPPVKKTEYGEFIVPPGHQAYIAAITFSSDSWNGVSWAAGTIRLGDGRTQDISSGSKTLDNANPYYAFWVWGNNTLQWTQDTSNIIGEQMGLCAVAKRGADVTDKAYVANHFQESILINRQAVMDNLVTELKLASSAVTEAKIASSAVTGGKIAALSIVGGHIQASSIAAGHIATGAITSEKIYAGAVTAVKIDSYAIDATKLAATIILSSIIWAGNNKVKLSSSGINVYAQSPDAAVFNFCDTSGNIKGYIFYSATDSAVELIGSATNAGIRLSANAANISFAMGEGYYMVVGGSGVYPSVTNSQYCGTASSYWYASYANYVMYKYHGAFDHKDDFALIKNIKPDKKNPTRADKNTLPDEVLERTPDGDHFIRMGDMMGLLQGTLKKLILRVEAIEAILDKRGK